MVRGWRANPCSVLVTASLICGLLCAVGGCGPFNLFGEPADRGAVFINGVEQLSPPAVAEAGLYKPDVTFPVDPGDAGAGRASGFFLDLSTASPGQLQMRLSGEDASPVALQRISALPDEAITPPGGGNLSAEARDWLRAGQGVFWLTDESSRGLSHRAGVVLPDTWTQPSVNLEVFAATTSTGDPILPGRVELAHSFFYMAAIGDSVMWGNGLRESQKFSRIVAAEIQRRTGRRVVFQVQALSSAQIVPQPTDVICQFRCNGEAGQANTSVTTQVDLLEAPTVLDLTLVDGCINDVGVFTILNADSLPDALAELTRSDCHDEMLKLLRKVRAAAPASAIVVTGYFPIVSSESKVPETAQFLLVNNAASDPNAAGVLPKLVNNASVFLTTSDSSLTTAVQDANAESGGPARIGFASPGFGPQNSVFASQPLLWGLTADRIQQQAAEQGLTLFPEDPQATLRATQCLQSAMGDPTGCLYSSVGHPNEAGAQRYAQAILPVLEQLGVIPMSTN